MRNTIQCIAAATGRLADATGRAATWCCLFVVLAEFALVVVCASSAAGPIRMREFVALRASPFLLIRLMMLPALRFPPGLAT